MHISCTAHTNRNQSVPHPLMPRPNPLPLSPSASPPVPHALLYHAIAFPVCPYIPLLSRGFALKAHFVNCKYPGRQTQVRLLKVWPHLLARDSSRSKGKGRHWDESQFRGVHEQAAGSFFRSEKKARSHLGGESMEPPMFHFHPPHLNKVCQGTPLRIWATISEGGRWRGEPGWPLGPAPSRPAAGQLICRWRVIIEP